MSLTRHYQTHASIGSVRSRNNHRAVQHRCKVRSGGAVHETAGECSEKKKENNNNVQIEKNKEEFFCDRGKVKRLKTLTNMLVHKHDN